MTNTETPALNFSDPVDVPTPETKAPNPFATKVAELAESGKAQPVTVPTADLKTHKASLNAAGRAIGKSVRKTVTEVDGETSKILFWVVDKIERPRPAGGTADLPTEPAAPTVTPV